MTLPNSCASRPSSDPVIRHCTVAIQTMRVFLPSVASTRNASSGCAAGADRDADYLALSPPIVEVVEGYWDREWGFATKQPSPVQTGALRPG